MTPTPISPFTAVASRLRTRSMLRTGDYVSGLLMGLIRLHASMEAQRRAMSR